MPKDPSQPGETTSSICLPSAADPAQPQVPPPRECPKPEEEDPEAQRRLEVILASRAYRQADEDVEFLNTYETRGVRLQIDYLKAELALERLGVQGTLVVFGGTRIQEPAAAKRCVEELRAALAAHPGDAALTRRLACAESLLEKSRFYEIARELGRLVAAAGGGPKDDRLLVMTGGGPGIMEAANRGAFEAGARSVGLNITLPHEQYPNPYIAPELCFRFHYFAIRKLHFLLRAKALIAFPGGYGTFDELFETLTLVQTRTIRPVPVILVCEAYWRRAFDVDFLVDQGVIDAEDKGLFWYAETAREIWEGILKWYEEAGNPLLS